MCMIDKFSYLEKKKAKNKKQTLNFQNANWLIFFLIGKQNIFRRGTII